VEILPAAQNGVQLKTCDSFISGIFHLLILDFPDQQCKVTVHIRGYY
jgi:hypothetical protein